MSLVSRFLRVSMCSLVALVGILLFAPPANAAPPAVESLIMTSDSGVSGTVYAGDTVSLELVTDIGIEVPAITIAGQSAGVKETRSSSGLRDRYRKFLCQIGISRYCTSNSGVRYWEASVVMPLGYANGPIPFSVGPLVGTDGETSSSVFTTVTSGAPVSFYRTLSPTYCIWDKEEGVTVERAGVPRIESPLDYRGHRYIIDPLCEPTALIAQLNLSTGSTNYTVSTQTDDRLSTYTSCGFLCFTKNERLRVQRGSKTETIGTLPPFITPGESVRLTWDCQPFQDLLWVKFSQTLWGAFNLVDHDPKVDRFNYTSNPRGTGFSTNSAYRGAVDVVTEDTQIFVLACGNQYTSPEIELRVDNPKGSITASPSQVSPGSGTRLTWSAQNVENDSCMVTDPAGTVIGTPGTSSGRNVPTGPIPLSLGETVIYTLTCTRYSGEAISWKSNPVTIANSCSSAYDASKPAVCSFNAEPPSVLQGGAVSLSWYCPNTYSTYALQSSLDSGSSWATITNGAVPNSGGERTRPIANGSGPQQNTLYRLVCSEPSGISGVGTDNVSVPQPNLLLSANPIALTPLAPVTTLTWSANNVNPNSCSLTDSNGTLLAENTNASSGPGLSLTPIFDDLPVTYTLTCQTPASAASNASSPQTSVTVYNADDLPIIENIWSEPNLVRKGNSATLHWSGSNLPPICTLSSSLVLPGLPRDVSSTPMGSPSDGVRVGPIVQPTIFTLTCEIATGSHTVRLLPEFEER